MNLSDTLLPAEKGKLDLRLLLGTFGKRQLAFLTLGCLILLRALILAPHCQDATKFTPLPESIHHIMLDVSV